jgi:hypothetical protein
MPTKPVSIIAQQLNAAQLAITNSLGDAEIKAAVAQYVYTTSKLNRGKALYEAALAAVNAQKTATADLKAKQKEAQDAYQAAAQVARAALAPEDLATLGLAGKTPRDTAGFIAAGYTLLGGCLWNYHSWG